MLQLRPVPLPYHSRPGNDCPPRDRCFEDMRRHADNCGCNHYRQYFNDHCERIRERCRDRNPHDYRTDHNGCRYEGGRPAQTQIVEQSATKATIMAGQYKLSFDKADKSVTIQGRDGQEKKYDWKIFEDPHISKDGKELGTAKNNLHIDMEDGTKFDILMGDGKGGPPQAGKQTFVESVASRTPDGTGALVTGISSGATLGVTPLDSSCASEYIESRELNKFGNYTSSRVAINRDGNMVDESSGQIVHDQYGLDRLDQNQVSRQAASSMYQQGYVPREVADQYNQPLRDYTEDMQMRAADKMSEILQRLNQLRKACPDFSSIGISMARYSHHFHHRHHGMVA